ncbi:MAG: glucosaminidase domain-containing protein, partial [Hyphomicrobiaceae bacterium]
MRFFARLSLPSSALAGAGIAAGMLIVPASAAITPAIQISPSNQVPACVTPKRLMAFLKRRNKKLNKRFTPVAAAYQKHGRDLGVRWDYAFFQMIVETNYLKYKTGSGRWGDVKPKQNNFAGIGATGGGEPGESFKSIDKGVR